MRRLSRDPAWPAPRLLSRPPILVLLALALTIPFFVPIPVEARRHVLMSGLGDRLHIVLMAGIVLMFYWWGPLRGRLALASALTAVLGAAIEVLQRFVGRSMLLHDWILDLVGIGMVIGWVRWRGLHKSDGLALMAVLAAFTAWELRDLPPAMAAANAARGRFPVLENAEGRTARSLWTDNYDAVLTVETDAADPANSVLRLAGGPPDRWPGATMRRFPYDWSAYSALDVDVRVATPGRDEARFCIRVDDFEAVRDRDWISDCFVATDTWTTVSVPLAGRLTRTRERPFDLTDVDAVTVFLLRPDSLTTLEFDNLRLR